MLLSKLARSFWSRSRGLPAKSSAIVAKQPVRHGSKKVMYVFASDHTGRKFRRYLLYYVLLGAIPSGCLVFYTSFIMGEAELYDYDPEVFEPEFHEFFAHPLKRFMAKYCVEDPKLHHYKMIYALEFEGHHRRMIQLVNSVREIEKHMGFKGWSRWEGPIRNKMLVADIDKYLEEHDIPVKAKR